MMIYDEFTSQPEQFIVIYDLKQVIKSCYFSSARKCMFDGCQSMILYFLISQVLGYFSIDQFGAIPYQDTVETQFINSRAFVKALIAANTSLQNDRTVIVPPHTYYFMPVSASRLQNVTIQIEGRIVATKNVSMWPTQPGSTHYKNFMQFDEGNGIVLEGGGKIDGRGYHWWVLTLLGGKNKHLKNLSDRPHLMQFNRISNFVLRNLRLKNSPQFHVLIYDCTNGTIHGIDIRVNVTAQINLLKYFSLEGVIPMYAFNTDGIDPSGSNFHIYNVTIQNYDDAVVPKPSHRGRVMSDCTKNFLVENITVILGVGMSVGSVPPNTEHNCVRNVTFQNIVFKRPFKGIYIKTNPGDKGDGEITDIIYQNIHMDRPIWWAVYIGPQQMKEPDGGGPGCLLYPYDPHHTCHTQPRITITRVSIINVTIHDSLLYPITIRCDPANPCREITFQDVHADKWLIGQKKTGMVCQNVRGRQTNTSPPIYCMSQQREITPMSQQRIKPVENDHENIRTMLGWEELERIVRDTVRVDDESDDMDALSDIIQLYALQS